MAVDSAPILSIQQVVAIKEETTTGTPIAVTAADATAHIFNPVMTYDPDAIERPGFGTLSPVKAGRGASSGTFTAESELVGAGASGTADWMTWMKSCGAQLAGGVLTPKTAAMNTLTIADYMGGRLKRLAGCQGSNVLTIRRGEPGRFRWTFKGVPQNPSDTAILAPTKTTVVAPRAGVSALTVGGATIFVDQLEVDFGQNVIMRQDVAQANAAGYVTGFRSALITSRKPVIRLAPEAKLLAALDYYDKHRTSTTIALSFTIGAAANNTFAFSFPTLDVENMPTTGDRDGIMTDVIELTMVGGASGDDEWSITAS